MHRSLRVLGLGAAFALMVGSLLFGGGRPAYAEDPRPTPTPTVPVGTNGSGGGEHPGG